MWNLIIGWIISAILTIALAPRPKFAKPRPFTSFEAPTVSTSRAIPVVFGRVRLLDANVAWWGDVRRRAITETVSTGLFSKEKVTKGWKYDVGMHLVLCRGPVDRVERIEAGDREAWAGSVTTNTRVFIDQGRLFGGENREGGIKGDVDFEFGASDQAVNDYLQARMVCEGCYCPAFRGVVALVLRQVYLSANSAHLKPWVVDVVRCPGRDWYPETAEIGEGYANPVHCLRELILDGDWGMGRDPAEIDDDRFRAAALACFEEGFGVGWQWGEPSPVEEVVQAILDTLAATLYRDPASGLFVVELVRGGYDPSALPLYDPSRIVACDSYSRRTLSEAVTEVQVTYADWGSAKEDVVTAQDLALVAAVGANVVDSRNYPMIRDAELAGRLAARELRSAGALTARARLRLDRSGAALRPGALFRWSWPEYGVQEMVLRAVAVDYGALESGEVVVEAVQDIYSLPGASYGDDSPGEWEQPIGEPLPSPARLVYEAPYWDLVERFSPADLAALTDDNGVLLAVAARPQAESGSYLLYTDGADGPYTSRDVGAWAAWGTLSAWLPYPDGSGTDTITLTPGEDLETLPGVRYLLVGAEVCEVVAVLGPASVQIRRGCLDSVAQQHAAGTTVWGAGGWASRDYTRYLSGQVAGAKVLTQTDRGDLELDDAPADDLTFAARWSRPYPPGRLRLNGAAYPAVVEGVVTVEWAHRDRITQGSTVLGEEALSVGPEPGTTYTLEIYDEAGALLRTESGLTGTSYTYSAEAADTGGDLSPRLRVVLYAERDGRASWQAHDTYINRAGYGALYGHYYGGPDL
jgi:hypothetical protein